MTTAKLTIFERQITATLMIAYFTPWSSEAVKKEAVKHLKDAEADFLSGNESRISGLLIQASGLAVQNAKNASDANHSRAMLRLAEICQTLASQIDQPAKFSKRLHSVR